MRREGNDRKKRRKEGKGGRKEGRQGEREEGRKVTETNEREKKRSKIELPGPIDHTRPAILCFPQLLFEAQILHFETNK